MCSFETRESESMQMLIFNPQRFLQMSGAVCPFPYKVLVKTKQKKKINLWLDVISVLFGSV